MKELGSDAKNLHHSAGEKIHAAGIDYLIFYLRGIKCEILRLHLVKVRITLMSKKN